MRFADVPCGSLYALSGDSYQEAYSGVAVPLGALDHASAAQLAELGPRFLRCASAIAGVIASHSFSRAHFRSATLRHCQACRHAEMLRIIVAYHCTQCWHAGLRRNSVAQNRDTGLSSSIVTCSSIALARSAYGMCP